MSYKCKITLKDNYLIAEVSGEWVPGKEAEFSKRVLAKIAGACKKTGFYRILAIWDVPGRLPAEAAQQIAESPQDYDWEQYFKVAIVYTHPERRKDSLVVEHLANVKGYPFKLFVDQEEALEWLLKH